MKRKELLAFFLSLGCAVLLILLFKLGVFESMELKSLDFRFRHFNHPEKASRDVVLVAIDEKSLREFKQNNIYWKWPRDIYGALVQYLKRGGTKVIVFDILFSDPDVDRLSSDASETDGALASAIAEASNVALAVHLRQDEDLLQGDNLLVLQNRFQFKRDSDQIGFEKFSSAVLPIPLFQNSAAALGSANYHDDKDGICRRLPLLFGFQNLIFPHLGIAAYLLSKESTQIKIGAKTISLGELAVPVDHDGQFLVFWYGKGGPDGSFAYYSIGALIASAIAEETGQTPILPSSHFKDKIVIIGANAPALSDFRSTPFTVYEPYPGMEIYATVISNLLQHDFLHRAHFIFPLLAILFFVFVVCYAFLYSNKVRLVLSISLICAIGWFAVSLGLFLWNKIWLDLIAPELAIVIAFSVAAVVSYQTEGRARRHLRSMFGKYLSPVVISEIIEKTDKVELGGKELKTTIYFSDIKDFTSISEQMTPSNLVTLLNEYFSVNTDIVLRHQGMLDKYIGDAVMAVFGAPIPIENHAYLACSTALEVQKVLSELAQNEWKNKPEMITRIGINSGTVVVGNIGSNLRLDYTAIGDSVNLASRLEGVNKVFGSRILISESTHEQIKDIFLTRQLDRLRVKGKQKPIRIYELVGKSGEVAPKFLTRIDRFQEGIRCYNEKSFVVALKIFQSILADFPTDGPSKVYVDRCDRFIVSPPPEDWDGVFKMETK